MILKQGFQNKASHIASNVYVQSLFPTSTFTTVAQSIIA